MGIGDTGISSSYKVPRYIAKIIFGAGAVSAGSGRLKCLLVGMKTAAGSMVADQDIVRITSEDEADAYAGVGSQLARMCYKALAIPSLELYIAAVTEPGAGTQATVTCVLTGTISAGTLRFRLAGKAIAVAVSATMTLDDVGTAIAAAFTAQTKLPATCAYNTGTDTVTWTQKNKGASGKDWILYFDPTDKPSGLTLTITGSATLNTNGYRFGAAGSGTGTEDVTTLLTKLTTGRYARIGVAQNDASNAALWETHVNTKAGPLSLNLEQLVFASNAALATAQSLAQTTLNAFRAQVLWMRNSESHPCEIAAVKAAIRAVTEQASPVPDYDGLSLPGIAPQAFAADIPTDTEQDTALNNGLVPVTTVGSTAKVVRSITSYCLNGTAQDERCLDIGDAVMTDYAVIDSKLLYETEFRPQNPYVGPDPADGEEPPPAGVAYPKLWVSAQQGRLLDYYANGWLEERPVGAWAPMPAFNKAGRYIQCDTPLAVRRVQHRLDNVVRQIFNTA
jgi:phage tail sheath gpL-like